MKRAMLLTVGTLTALTGGCLDPKFNPLAPEPAEPTTVERAADPDLDKPVKYIGEVTEVANAEPIVVSGVGLVIGLDGTGAPAPPGGYRTMLEEQLRRKGVENIKEVLASNDCSMVLLSAVIPAGARKGDSIDIDVTLPPGSRAVSLRGGQLIETTLVNFDTVGNVRNHLRHANSDYNPGSTADGILMGHPLVSAVGPLLTGVGKAGEAGVNSLKTARVWGGGRCRIDRPFFLVLNQRRRVWVAMKIAERINETFSLVGRTQLAEAKTPEVISIQVPPQYKLNQERFLRVVRAIPVDAAEVTPEFLRELTIELGNPQTCILAALRLEAIGTRAAANLKEGLASPYPIVRFAAAEALAYLGEPIAANELAKLAVAEPYLQAYCLTALASMDEGGSFERLTELLAQPDPKIRYGAFRALQKLDARNPAARGELLNKSFTLHAVAKGSSPMVHFLTGRKAEIVLFGENPALLAPFTIMAGPDFTLTAGADDRHCTISRYSLKRGKASKQCSFALQDIIRTMAELGAGYPDIVDLLRAAEEGKNLNCMLGVDALPRAPDVKELAVIGKTNPNLRILGEFGANASGLGRTPTLFDTGEAHTNVSRHEYLDNTVGGGAK